MIPGIILLLLFSVATRGGVTSAIAAGVAFVLVLVHNNVSRPAAYASVSVFLLLGIVEDLMPHLSLPPLSLQIVVAVGVLLVAAVMGVRRHTSIIPDKAT